MFTWSVLYLETMWARLTSRCIYRLASQQPVRLLRTSTPLAKSFDISNGEEFDKKVMSAEKAVVVDFHAEWCGPCRSLTPLLEEAVKSTKDEVDLARVDIDQLGELAIKYGVTAVPSVFLMKNGRIVERFVGLKDSAFLQKFVRAANDT